MAYSPVAEAPSVTQVDGVDFSHAPLTVVMGTLFDISEAAFAKRPVWAEQSQLAFQATLVTLRRLRRLGIPVVIADGGSSQHVLDVFGEFPNVTLFTGARPGLATQYVDGMAFALEHGATGIIRMESFKYGVAIEETLAAITRALATYDLVEVGRDAASMASLPFVQRRTEGSMGRLFFHAGWSAGYDALCGVRAYSEHGARTFVAQYEGYLQEHGQFVNTWLHLYIPTILQHDWDLRVGAIVVKMLYDDAMTDYENGQPELVGKRFEQALMQEARLSGLFPNISLAGSDFMGDVEPGLFTLSHAYTSAMVANG